MYNKPILHPYGQTAGTGMAFCGQYPRKGFTFQEDNAHDTQVSEAYPALHNMPKMSKFEVTARFGWSLLEKDT